MSDPTAIVVSDPYLIVEVQPKWALGPETMGSKTKFWYRSPAPQANPWLFKHPQLHTGQHWAEKIAAEIAALLAIPHARVELAVFSEQRGSATESFIRGGQELIHGNQMLAGVVHGYNREKKFGQSSHTLANIWQVMDRVFVRSEAARRAKLCMAEYMVLDALIGNTDRHHENWGVVWKREGGRWRGMIAPSFDHASSLGRELPDTHRERRLTENSVGKYAEKGRGALYWSEDERRGPSPLELVRRAAHKYPDLFRQASRKLERVDEAELRQIVARIPPDWMTPLSRVFALALVCYNFEQLQELFR